MHPPIHHSLIRPMPKRRKIRPPVTKGLTLAQIVAGLSIGFLIVGNVWVSFLDTI